MARLIRKQTTHYHDAAGKRVPAGTPGAVRVVVTSRKWYGAGVTGWPAGKAVPLATDKRVAERMLAELVRKAELGNAGLSAVSAHTVLVTALLDEFREAVARKAGPKHTAAVIRDAKLVMGGCQVRTLADLHADELTTRAERFVWSLTPAMTAPTAAYVGKHARQFTRWLWRKRKLLDHDPLSGMDLPSQETVNRRRALTADELARLIAAASASAWAFRGLTGADRTALYATAVTTGLRVTELSALTADHFRLDGGRPTVSLPGSLTKNGKDATLPVPPDTAALVRPLLARRPSGRLWPGTWWERSAKMIRRDYTDAGIPHKTAAGIADFHTLRHTFTTILGRSAPLKVVQELARHSSPVLTVGRYSHAEEDEKAEAVATIRLGVASTNHRVEPDAESAREFLAALGLSLFALLFAPAQRTLADEGGL